MRRLAPTLPLALLSLLAACGDNGNTSASQGSTTAPTGVTATDDSASSTPTTTPTDGSISASNSATDPTGSASATDSATSDGSSTGNISASNSDSATDSTGPAIKLDVGDSGDTDTTDTGVPVDKCKATDDNMNGVGDCTMKAPPDAFEPDIQWSWNGPGAEKESLVTPLVANLTDDNNDGAIDLCDIPDIIVTVTAFPAPGHIYVLDGATGSLHFMIPTAITWSINPAIGDIDGDGLPEIVAAVGEGFGGPSSAIAFEHDGAVKWQSAAAVTHSQGGAITLADLDNDGSAEIVVVSDSGFQNNQTAPTVQVIRDIEDRWIQARRIWNQHTYHVTNVREDGKIPQFEQPSWKGLNTFRTNSQIEGGEVCQPIPQ